MKTRLCLLLIFAIPWSLALNAAVTTEVVTVAVFDPEASEPKLKERGSQLALLLSAQLSLLEGVAVVERQELAKLLSEQELGASGLVTTGTAARIGSLIGARILITGRIFTAGGESTATLKIMSAETSRVFGAVERFSADTPLSQVAESLGTKVAALLKSKRADLIAADVVPADRVNELKILIAGRALPSLTVSIPEQHVGPPVIDPAAETEIELILGQAGFPLFSHEAGATADIRIVGEAFSETGIRRGNLIACRARVEVKVIERKSGRLLHSDRQMSWAVDTTEHIAAKAALQKAGAELSTRIAQVLLQMK